VDRAAEEALHQGPGRRRLTARAAPGGGSLRRVNRRPRLELHGSTASPAEAAAVIAAIEQFLRDTAPPPAAPVTRQDPWVRAALLEGVGREPDAPAPWGDPHPWGA
jgi:hypothetical protein